MCWYTTAEFQKKVIPTVTFGARGRPTLLDGSVSYEPKKRLKEFFFHIGEVKFVNTSILLQLAT